MLSDILRIFLYIEFTLAAPQPTSFRSDGLQGMGPVEEEEDEVSAKNLSSPLTHNTVGYVNICPVLTGSEILW
jgi:hypothetical protein